MSYHHVGSNTILQVFLILIFAVVTGFVFAEPPPRDGNTRGKWLGHIRVATASLMVGLFVYLTQARPWYGVAFLVGAPLGVVLRLMARPR
jgi:hypothetical protein